MPKRYLLWLVIGALVVLSTTIGLGAIFHSQAAAVGAVIAVGAVGVGATVAPSISSRNRLTLAISVGAALPFVFTVDDRVDGLAVFGVFLLGSELVAVIEAVRTGSIRRALSYAGRQVVAFSAFIVVFGLVRHLVGSSLGTTSGWEILVPFVAAGAAWIAVEITIWSLLTATAARMSARYVALSGLKDLNVFISLIATGGLFGLMYDAIGWWALPVALLPYSFAHSAFRRFQETKSTYRQTIRALAQIPEASGLNLTGHSDRTTALAVAMAQDLGLSPDEVDDVEFAALMHDIGHITLNDPMVIEQGWTKEDLARWGSEIIAGAPSLNRVAGHVRRQYEPYRNPGEESDLSLSRVSRIVKVASAYDAHRVGEGMSQLESLEELHKGIAYDYDPDVVASLRRVLESAQTATA